MTFSEKSNLKAHFKTIHDGEKPFGCEVCEKRFSSKRNRNEHVASHSDERPFGCDYCPKDFKIKKKLDRHISAIHKSSIKERIHKGC